MRWLLLIIFLAGCASPQTHDEWATRCVGQSSPDDFNKCVKKWDEWSRKQLGD